MADAPIALPPTYHPWGRGGTLRLLAAMALAGVLLASIIAPALLPADPFEPLNLLFAGWAGGSWQIVKAAALLAVLAGLGAALVRRPPDAGLLIATLALVALAGQRPGMIYLLVRAHPGPGPASGAIYATLATEAALWIGMVLLAWLVGRVVETRVFGVDFTLPQVGRQEPLDPAHWWVDETPRGLLATAIVLGGGGLAMAVLAQTLDPHQVYFAAGLSLFLGTLIAHRLTAFRMALWPLLGLLGIALAGFLLASTQPHAARPYELLSLLPPNPWTFPTPAQYAAWGGLGVLSGMWFSQRLHRQETQDAQAALTDDAAPASTPPEVQP